MGAVTKAIVTVTEWWKEGVKQVAGFGYDAIKQFTIGFITNAGKGW